jgi:hypothetical protein
VSINIIVAIAGIWSNRLVLYISKYSDYKLCARVQWREVNLSLVVPGLSLAALLINLYRLLRPLSDVTHAPVADQAYLLVFP